MRPPGLTTRASSAAATDWRGANMIPNVESATSKLASSNGSASASASTHSTSTPAASARRRPGTNSSGVRSEATTEAPRCAAWIAALPLPAAMSSTRSEGPQRAASAAIAPASQISCATASKSPAAHVARACCLMDAISLMARLSQGAQALHRPSAQVANARSTASANSAIEA